MIFTKQSGLLRMLAANGRALLMPKSAPRLVHAYADLAASARTNAFRKSQPVGSFFSRSVGLTRLQPGRVHPQDVSPFTANPTKYPNSGHVRDMIAANKVYSSIPQSQGSITYGSGISTDTAGGFLSHKARTEINALMKSTGLKPEAVLDRSTGALQPSSVRFMLGDRVLGRVPNVRAHDIGNPYLPPGHEFGDLAAFKRDFIRSLNPAKYPNYTRLPFQADPNAIKELLRRIVPAGVGVGGVATALGMPQSVRDTLEQKLRGLTGSVWQTAMPPIKKLYDYYRRNAPNRQPYRVPFTESN